MRVTVMSLRAVICYARGGSIFISCGAHCSHAKRKMASVKTRTPVIDYVMNSVNSDKMMRQARLHVRAKKTATFVIIRDNEAYERQQ